MAMAVVSNGVKFSTEIRGFVLADFSGEVSFGVRNIPPSLANFGPRALPILCYVPDFFEISSVRVCDVLFHGFAVEEALDGPLKPSGHIKMKRNFSLDEGVASPAFPTNPPPKLQRSLSSAIDTSSMVGPNNDLLLLNGVAHTRPGSIKQTELLKGSR
jgi:hypothetical protein